MADQQVWLDTLYIKEFGQTANDHGLHRFLLSQSESLLQTMNRRAKIRQVAVNLGAKQEKIDVCVIKSLWGGYEM
jgi:hypothetical protein